MVTLETKSFFSLARNGRKVSILGGGDVDRRERFSDADGSGRRATVTFAVLDATFALTASRVV